MRRMRWEGDRRWSLGLEALREGAGVLRAGIRVS